MFKTVRRLLGNKSGATAIEYGLIAALISIAAITAMGTVGDSLEDNFDAVSKALKDGPDAVEGTGNNDGGEEGQVEG